MDAIRHIVGCERLPDLLDYRFMRWDFGKGQGQCGTAQAIEMFSEFEDATFVEPETLPDSVAPLHGRVERAHGGLVAVDQIPVDVHDQVFVLLVESLMHATYRSRNS
jgi:hypothetical protein